jgi:hypothetical protein
MTFRVFGASEAEPSPAAILEYLHAIDARVRARFRGDDQGWFDVELRLAGEEALLRLERFLAAEEGIRAELNTWAAWLETHEDNPHRDRLMVQVIGTKQVFTMREEENEETVPVAIAAGICQYLARVTEGVYQVDGKGFFDATGKLLVSEDV